MRETITKNLIATAPVLSLKDTILHVLDESKAEDISVIDLTGKSDIADFMVIASGNSNRHVGAIADRLLTKFREIGLHTVQAEGTEDCNWVLVDAFDVIVHIFRPEVREYYNLEKMWQAVLPERVEEVQVIS